jgi:tetratricopeptide (TPR) repeat protein
MRLFVLALSLVMALPALSCINEFGTGTTLQSKQIGFTDGTQTPEEYVNGLSSREPQSLWAERKTTLESVLAGSPTFEQRNDYGAALIRLGDYEQARVFFEELEKAAPGNYSTAANLGTAYELLGQPLKALEWIKEGVRRNPASHEGSEWLHVKILEAKLMLAKDPGWLKTHSVSGADFGTGLAPAKPSLPRDFLGNAKTLENVRDALFYQLHERLYFVSPPEPIVADLLFDLGNALAHTLSLEHASAVYGLSLEFKPDKPVAARRKRLDSMIEWAALKDDLLGLGAFLALVGLVVGLIVLLVLRVSRRNRNATRPASTHNG